MSRGLWFVAGAASGVYAVAKARRTALMFTPDGIGARLAALQAGARVFTGSLATQMADREAVLLAQLDQEPSSPRRLPSTGAPHASDSGSTNAPPDVEGGSDGNR